jgi:hypothetical protein
MEFFSGQWIVYKGIVGQVLGAHSGHNVFCAFGIPNFLCYFTVKVSEVKLVR